MTEQSGWLKRMISGDASMVQLQGKLATLAADLDNTARALRSEQEQSALKDKELHGLRETLEQSTGRVEQFKQDLERTHRELAQSRAEVVAERNKLELERVEFERLMNEAKAQLERTVNEGKGQSERSRLLAEAEKMKTKSAYSQVQGLEKRLETLQQQCAHKDHELMQVHAQLKTAQGQAEGTDKIKDELKKKAEELTRLRSEWGSQRAGLDATILKMRSRQEEHLQRMGALEGDLAEAVERQRVAEEASRNEKQATVHARAELDRVRKAQDLLLRDERVRFTILANRLWKALERALGKGASVALGSVLDGEESLVPTPKGKSIVEASAALEQVLAQLAPKTVVSGTELEGGGFELRIRRPSATPDACAPGWLAVYAVQVLSRSLGKALRASNVGQNGAEVVVRVRPRETNEVAPLAG